MNVRQMLLLLIGLLAGSLALAQPEAGGKDRVKGDRPAKAAPAVVTVQGEVKELRVGKGTMAMTMIAVATAEKSVHVALAPQAFLDNAGLKLKVGNKVTVNGWEPGQAKEGKPKMLNARDLVFDGKTYSFRNEKGQPLWNAVEFLPKVTIDGTIKEIVTPEPPRKPAAGDQPKPAEKPKDKGLREPAIILHTDKGEVTIIGVPMQLVEKLGLKLEVGMKLSVAGWHQERGKQTAVLARTLTAGEKTVTLRDETGKMAVEPRGEKPARDGRGKGKKAEGK
jgi:hypothetical protein